MWIFKINKPLYFWKRNQVNQLEILILLIDLKTLTY